MATFLRNLFGTPKTLKTPKEANNRSQNDNHQEDDAEIEPVTPDRRLSLSKSGKMKRKSYGRQVSVTDKNFYRNPENGERKKSTAATENCRDGNNLRDDENIDEILKDMLEVAETTRM